MLAATGQAPLSDLNSVTAADSVIAVNTLRDTCRQVQELGWKFNTEWGVTVAPTLTPFSWSELGTTINISIYTPPAGMIAFTVSPIAAQMDKQTAKLLDITTRPSKQYLVNGVPVLVLYDRVANRDGFPVADRTNLWLDTISLFNFEQMPDVARQYVMVMATRRYLARVMPSGSLVGFTERDELIALRALEREQGEVDVYNMMDHPDVARALGDRPRYTSEFIQLRSNP